MKMIRLYASGTIPTRKYDWKDLYVCFQRPYRQEKKKMKTRMYVFKGRTYEERKYEKLVCIIGESIHTRKE